MDGDIRTGRIDLKLTPKIGIKSSNFVGLHRNVVDRACDELCGRIATDLLAGVIVQARKTENMLAVKYDVLGRQWFAAAMTETL
jgi:hypothetical protein